MGAKSRVDAKTVGAGVGKFVHAARAQPTRGGRIRASSSRAQQGHVLHCPSEVFRQPYGYTEAGTSVPARTRRDVTCLDFPLQGASVQGHFGAFWRIDGLGGATSSACGRPVLPIGPLECSRSTRTSAHGENGEMGFLCQEMGPRSALASAGGRPVCQIHSSHVKKREGRFAPAERGMRSGEQ